MSSPQESNRKATEPGKQLQFTPQPPNQNTHSPCESDEFFFLFYTYSDFVSLNKFYFQDGGGGEDQQPKQQVLTQ